MTEKPLSPIEIWMVKSNLDRIKEENLNADDVVAQLAVNGYHRIAKAVQIMIAKLLMFL